MILALWAMSAAKTMAEPVQSYDWRFFTDQVMGGLSEGQARIDAQGLHLTGQVSTANNGGFIQARSEDVRVPQEAQGLRIRVRGDGQRYFIHLRTSGTLLPWQYYQAGFDTNGDWQEITLPFESFAPSGRMLRDTPRPDDIRSVALVAYGRDHSADIRLSALSGY